VKAKLTRTETATAYHEAGHAVAFHVLRGSAPARGAAIRAGRGLLGQTRDVRLPSHADREPASIEADVVFAYAGAAAELHFEPEVDLEEVRAGARDDDERAAELLDFLGAASRESEFRARAECLIRECWPLVEAVAHELLIHLALHGRGRAHSCSRASAT
jgi:Peptidase family M41